MKMVHLGDQTDQLHIINAATAVDCGREVRFRRSFRSLMEFIVPCCGFPQPSISTCSDTDSLYGSSISSTVTGTIYGYRNGRVSFCIQDDARSSYRPLLLVEFAVPTAYLAREMKQGILRIALECDGRKESDSCSSIFSVPIWSMYCNGRKVGFAMKREMKARDASVLKLMRSVSAGAGVLPPDSVSNKSAATGEEDFDDNGGELMYLRASFERVIGSSDSESFHMINPVGSCGQELSIFLLRS